MPVCLHAGMFICWRDRMHTSHVHIYPCECVRVRMLQRIHVWDNFSYATFLIKENYVYINIICLSFSRLVTCCQTDNRSRFNIARYFPITVRLCVCLLLKFVDVIITVTRTHPRVSRYSVGKCSEIRERIMDLVK